MTPLVCTLGGVGVFHTKGWGAKKFSMPLETRQMKLFVGISRDFAWISRRHPKSLRKKEFVFNLCSLQQTLIPKGFGIRDRNVGRPKCRSNYDGSNPLFLGPSDVRALQTPEQYYIKIQAPMSWTFVQCWRWV